MSDKKKTIQINPQLFELGKSNKKNKLQTRKKRDISIVAPSNIKNEFIRKVKQHQHNKSKKKLQLEQDDNFSEDFKDTLNYMMELSKEKSKPTIQEPVIIAPVKHSKVNEFLSRDTNSQISTPNISTPKSSNITSELVELNLPDTLIDDKLNNTMIQTIPITRQTMKNNIQQEKQFNRLKRMKPMKKNTEIKNENAVPYGCLKNGNKPTYRTWMKTQKNKTSFQVNEKEKNDNNQKDECNNEIKPNIKFVTKRICKRRYKCGKSKKYRKVGIVLKSGKMRTKILSDKRTLKIKPIIDVKNELCKNGLLKIGSSAPKQLVYEIYENSKLTGDVKNKNKETLIHNYFNDNSDIK